jgi:hypothetical protein
MLRPNSANLQIQDLEDQVKFLKFNLELLAKKNLENYEPQKKVWYEAFDWVRQQARSLTTQYQAKKRKESFTSNWESIEKLIRS